MTSRVDNKQELAERMDGVSLEGAERFTMTEAARIKGVSYHTVSRAVRQGRLPVVRLGRMALIAGDDLESWQPMRERAPRKYRRDEEPLESVPAVMRGERLGDHLGLARHLSSLIEVLHAAASELSLEDFAAVLAREFAQTFALERVSVWSVNRARSQSTRLANVGGSLSSRPVSSTYAGGFDRLYTMIEKGSARVSANPSIEFREEGHEDAPLPVGPSLIVPLTIRGRAVGVLWADRKGERLALSPDHLSLAQVLGNQAALALENATLRKGETLRVAQLSTILDQIGDQVRACDAEGRINLINRADLNRARDGASPPKTGDNAFFHGGIRSRHELDGTEIPMDRHPLARALTGESVDNWEYIVSMIDGGEGRFRVSARPLVIDDEITGAVYIARDVTADHVRAMQHEERAARLAQQAARLQWFGEMVSAIAATDATGEVAQIALDTAVRVAGGIGGVSFQMLDGEALMPRVYAGAAAGVALSPAQNPIDNSTSILAVSRRELVEVPRANAASAEVESMDIVGATHLIVAPIASESRRLGVMHIYRTIPGPLPEDARILVTSICHHLAMFAERLLLGRAVERAHSRMVAVLSQSDHAVLVVDSAHSVILAANEAASVHWGMSIEPGVTRAMQLGMEDASGERLLQERHPIIAHMAGPEPLRSELVTIVGESGERRVMRITSIHTHDPNGRLNGSVCILEDRSATLALDQVRGEYLDCALSGLSQPVDDLERALRRYRPQFQQADSDTVRVSKDTIDQALSQIDDIRGLLGSVTDMTKADYGSQVVVLRRTDASVTLQSAVDAVIARNPTRDVRLTAPVTIPVVWDQERIQHLIRIVLGSVMGAASEGPIDIECSEIEDDVIIEIRGGGPQLAAIKLVELGQTSRLKNALPKHGNPGDLPSPATTLGLYLGHRIIGSHQGTLSIDPRGVVKLRVPAVAEVPRRP